jgi:hypothetical protein
VPDALGGREAIYLVARMTRSERGAARRGRNKTLARVATWPEAQPQAWFELLDVLGLAPVLFEPPRRMPTTKRGVLVDDLRDTWASRPWFDDELAEHYDVHVGTVEYWKKKWFPHAQWNVVQVGHRKARQLLIQETV